MSHLLDGSIRKSFAALCSELKSPVAQRALKMLNEDDWVGLTSIKIKPGDYSSPTAYLEDAQVAAFFKKFPDFDLGIDLEEKAVMSFWESERQCFLSNERLGPLLNDIYHYGEGVAAIFMDARKEVKRILGRCPSPGRLQGKFGPGSTFSDVGPYITVPDKMSSSATLTNRALPFLKEWRTTAWARYGAGLSLELCGPPSPFTSVDSMLDGFSRREPIEVRGNRFTTVPKDAWKLRGICIEPSLNVYYQLSVGTYMTMRLGRTCYWRKDSIQDHHKDLARVGSLTGALATIDLSNASDTICTALVKLLLPDDWFELLFSLRSSHTLIGEKWVRLEKFSSMGNGYTFELETILFRALAHSAIKWGNLLDENKGHTVLSVFGDDIIVPSSDAPDVVAVLNFCGLKVNEDKTFLTGKFRESCGGDYFDGKDVRPHYLKENPCEPHQFIALANGLRRFRIRITMCCGLDLYRLSWLRVLNSLPSSISKCRGPEILGDLVIHDEEEKWEYTVRGSRRYFRVWRPVGFGRINWFHFRPGVVLASALYGVPDGTSGRNPVSPNGSALVAEGIQLRVGGSYVKGYRFGRVAYS